MNKHKKFKPGDIIQAFSGIATVISKEEFESNKGFDCCKRGSVPYKYADGRIDHCGEEWLIENNSPEYIIKQLKLKPGDKVNAYSGIATVISREEFRANKKFECNKKSIPYKYPDGTIEHETEEWLIKQNPEYLKQLEVGDKIEECKSDAVEDVVIDNQFKFLLID